MATPEAVPVTIHVSAAVRAQVAVAPEISVEAASVGAVLEQLEAHHPALYRSICDDTGTVRRHINLFVNSSHLRDREGLDTVLSPGDVITILPAVSGG